MESCPAAKRARLSQSLERGTATSESQIAQTCFKVEATVTDTTVAGAAGTKSEVATGAGYLDHMVDQFTAHAQIAVKLQVWMDGNLMQPHSNLARDFSDEVGIEWARLVGRTFGTALHDLLPRAQDRGNASNGRVTCTFFAPLDEALSKISLSIPDPAEAISANKPVVELEPLGQFPSRGRSFIGGLRTALLQPFLSSLAAALGSLEVAAQRVRGDNGHHVVEATFKALARCFRKVMDEQSGFQLASPVEQVRPREGRLQRGTRETSIEVAVAFDPKESDAAGEIQTGLTTLDGLLKEIARCSGVSLVARCSGDLWIDDHHSAEDTMISLGKVINQALGDKAGLVRMACAEEACGDARVLCVMDLSNRPSFHSNIPLAEAGDEMVGDLSVEMLYHCFESLSFNALLTCHMVHVSAESVTPSVSDLGTAMARSFGKALRDCASVDPRRSGAIASSKGTLSK